MRCYDLNKTRQPLVDELLSAGAKINDSAVVCPYHPDTHASGSIFQSSKDHKFRFKCHACKVSGDVFDLYELRTGQIHPDLNTGLKGKPFAIFIYRDADGFIRYKKNKYLNGRYSWLTLNEHGRWIKNRNGPPLLYHLEEIANALPGSTLVITEGEKDVETLRSWGFIATTAPDGAGGWNAVLGQARKYFAEKQLLIIPDNDVAGQRYALEAACSLLSYVFSTKIINIHGLKPGGDITDYKEKGWTFEDLTTLINKTPLWTPSSIITEVPYQNIILKALLCGAKSQTNLYNMFHRNMSSAKLTGILKAMLYKGLISCNKEKTTKRTKTIWSITAQAITTNQKVIQFCDIQAHSQVQKNATSIHDIAIES